MIISSLNFYAFFDENDDSILNLALWNHCRQTYSWFHHSFDFLFLLSLFLSVWWVNRFCRICWNYNFC
jgi:hypothetical protein